MFVILHFKIFSYDLLVDPWQPATESRSHRPLGVRDHGFKTRTYVTFPTSKLILALRTDDWSR